MVENSEVIAVLNLRNSQIFDDFIKQYGSKYKIVDACEGQEYASCVLTEDTIYLSPISSLTLKRRFLSGPWEGACYEAGDLPEEGE